MEGIIKGEDLSTFKAVSISLNQAEKENNDGIKAKFAVISYQDRDGGDVVRDIKWQDQLGQAWLLLYQHRMMDAENKPIRDSKGGYLVDIMALKKTCLEFKKTVDPDEFEDSPQEEILKNILKARGGMQVPYKFPTGPRYANDVNGKPVTKKDGTRVVKEIISVFVRVKFIKPGDNGNPETIYVGGVSPEVKGQELMERFYKTPVNQGSTTIVEEHTSPEKKAEKAEEEAPF